MGKQKRTGASKRIAKQENKLRKFLPNIKISEFAKEKMLADRELTKLVYMRETVQRIKELNQQVSEFEQKWGKHGIHFDFLGAIQKKIKILDEKSPELVDKIFNAKRKSVLAEWDRRAKEEADTGVVMTTEDLSTGKKQRGRYGINGKKIADLPVEDGGRYGKRGPSAHKIPVKGKKKIKFTINGKTQLKRKQRVAKRRVVKGKLAQADYEAATQIFETFQNKVNGSNLTKKEKRITLDAISVRLKELNKTGDLASFKGNMLNLNNIASIQIKRREGKGAVHKAPQIVDKKKADIKKPAPPKIVGEKKEVFHHTKAPATVETEAGKISWEEDTVKKKPAAVPKKMEWDKIPKKPIPRKVMVMMGEKAPEISKKKIIKIKKPGLWERIKGRFGQKAPKKKKEVKAEKGGIISDKILSQKEGLERLEGWHKKRGMITPSKEWRRTKLSGRRPVTTVPKERIVGGKVRIEKTQVPMKKERIAGAVKSKLEQQTVVPAWRDLPTLKMDKLTLFSKQEISRMIQLQQTGQADAVNKRIQVRKKIKQDLERAFPTSWRPRLKIIEDLKKGRITEKQAIERVNEQLKMRNR